MQSVLRRVCGLTVCLSLWSVQVAFAEALTVQVVPAISDNYILADAVPANESGDDSLRIVAAPDQFEAAGFVVYATESLPKLQVSTSELRDLQGKTLAGARVDIRVVKRWYQRNFAFDTDQSDPRTRFIVPELLLHDDALVRVRDEQNFLRMESGEYINISTPGKLNGFGTPRSEEFPVRDATTLQPVDISAGDNRQFWVTVYVPAGAMPGRYVAEVILQSNQSLVASLPHVLEILPFELIMPDQLQIRLVDQLNGLHRVVSILATQERPCNNAQFVIHDRHDPHRGRRRPMEHGGDRRGRPQRT